MCTGNCCFKFWDGLLVYEEPRVIRIHSFVLTFIYWLACIGAGLFIGVYLIWYSQGYQYFDPVESAVTTKLFGVAKPNATGLDQFRKIWDNADYMVPPKENGAFTVITSVFVTPKQSQGTCDEDPTIRGVQCEVDADCTADKALLYGNGVMTGKCIVSTYMPSVKVCEITAWCPVEFDNSTKRIRLATENFTVFIRNNVKFPSFHINRQNIPNNMDDKELETCVFDPGHPRNKHCPVFKINTIVKEAGHRFNSMVSEGGVIEIIIDWDCNFDYRDECLPTYSFHRLDHLENAPSRGFHLRYADHYADSSDRFFRTLYRAYGIRVIVSVHGSGRKFSKRVTAKTIGSGLSFFGIAALIVSKGILRLYKMCCKRKCCLEDKYCTNFLKRYWTGCYDWCFCKPLDESMRTEQDKKADDLRATTFVFKDALKTCSRRCVLLGERDHYEPEIDQSSTALDTTHQPINSPAGNIDVIVKNRAYGLSSDVENSV